MHLRSPTYWPLFAKVDGEAAHPSSAGSSPPWRGEGLRLDLRRNLLAEDLHLVDELLHGVGGEVEPQEVRDTGLAKGDGLLDDLLGRADQVDLLVRGRALALERRLAERDQMPVHLAVAEALDRRLVRLADMDDELRADVDGPGRTSIRSIRDRMISTACGRAVSSSSTSCRDRCREGWDGSRLPGCLAWSSSRR